MAAPHILSANFKQGTFGGNTGSQLGPHPGTPAAPTLSEFADTAGLRTQLEDIVAGGVHPETFATAFAAPIRDVEQATASLRGPNGGLVPRATSNLQIGPAGQAIAARAKSLLSRVGL